MTFAAEHSEGAATEGTKSGGSCIGRRNKRTHSIKLDKLPEYIRDTVDWFIGKSRTGRGGVKGQHHHHNAASSSEENKLYLQPPLLELRIPEPELLFLTDLPDGLDDLNEWTALHTIAFFEHINLIYGTVSEFCSPGNCPEMAGPGNRTYVWIDDKGKKSKVNAPQYVDYIMTLAQKTINDEAVFPTKHGVQFPTTFEVTVKKLHKLLFHVLAHLYFAHFK